MPFTNLMRFGRPRATRVSINQPRIIMKAVAPWIALAVVGIAAAVAVVAVSFIENDMKVEIINPLQINVGKDHTPPPVTHIHIKKEGVWGL